MSQKFNEEELIEMRKEVNMCEEVLSNVVNMVAEKLNCTADENSNTTILNINANKNNPLASLIRKALNSALSDFKKSLPTMLNNLPILKDIKEQCAEHKERLNLWDQYTRKNCLILHGYLGISFNLHGSAFTKKVIEFLNKNLHGLLKKRLSVYDVDTSHPLQIKSGKRPVTIIKFVRRDLRNEILQKRKVLLKRTGIAVTEHLTAENLFLLKKTQEFAGFKNECLV